MPKLALTVSRLISAANSGIVSERNTGIRTSRLTSESTSRISGAWSRIVSLTSISLGATPPTYDLRAGLAGKPAASPSSRSLVSPASAMVGASRGIDQHPRIHAAAIEVNQGAELGALLRPAAVEAGEDEIGGVERARESAASPAELRATTLAA